MSTVDLLVCGAAATIGFAIARLFIRLRPRRSRERKGPEPRTVPIRIEDADLATDLGADARDPDGVVLGVAAPAAVRPDQEFTARFVAYVPSAEVVVRAALASLSPRSAAALGVKTCRWKTGTRVTVRLAARHLNVKPREVCFTWEGGYNILEFDVRVPKRAPHGVTVLRFEALIGGIVVANLRMDVAVQDAPPVRGQSFVRGAPVRTAFASYASQDRLRVLDRVAEIQRNGVEVFLDCLSLHPGEEWKPRLELEIQNREVFLLFWSTHARASSWVQWELRTALAYKGVEGIDPHPLDPVAVAEPPEELKPLHFGDPHMLLRSAYSDPGTCSGAQPPTAS